MDIMHVFLIAASLVGYFCGVSQGRKDILKQLEQINESKRYNKIDVERELDFVLDEGEQSPTKREQLEQQIRQLEKEIGWMQNLLSDIIM